MRNNALIQETKLLESRASVQRDRDTEYLMELKVENLLFSHYAEAGLNGLLNYTVKGAHGGWDSPTSQIRGTFVGHWLSAAARIINETSNNQLKAKADYIVAEIARCQEHNGNGWAFPIPEKYLYFVKAGKKFWAPQYVCHKNMMGLLDMYLYVHNQQALEIVEKCAEWFYDFSNSITRENMNTMMDNEETGAMMELWADLYSVTKNEKHLELMRRYERPKIIEPIFNGEDILTNVHANTTIPEIHGCARAYEVTGEERYRKIVENYWDLAVTQRGFYATGGQTCGEVWTPMQKQAARLSESNQEHCVVYNMIRLADYLFKWTGDAKYADYIELNIYNGLFAQGFWQARGRDTYCESLTPETGIVSYYLPLAPGSQKKWGSKTEDFWCCHGTAVQANAKYREYIYYQSIEGITIAQYFPSKLETKLEANLISIEQSYIDLSRRKLDLCDTSYILDSKPEIVAYQFKIKAAGKSKFKLRFRLPWWLKDEARFYINDERCLFEVSEGHAVIDRIWEDDSVKVIFPKGLSCYPLPDQKNTVAFLDGPILLVGLVDQQRRLYGDINMPESILQARDGREWDTWLNIYQTINQDVDFDFVPINEVGKEKYTVYFPIKEQ